jgi:peptide/nickel transport system permease protein
MMPLITTKKKQDYMRTMEAMTRKRTQWRDIARRLIKNKLAVVGLVIVVVLLVLVVFAGLFTRYQYDAQDFVSKFSFPSWSHLMGTDNFGRDIWTRLLYGGRISLLVAVLSVAFSLAIGIVLGATAGYFGGKYEVIVTRLLDIMMAIPALLLAIAISAVLGSGPLNTAIAIATAGISPSARIIRSTVMSIKGQEFVEAARATGSSHLRVIFRHIMPNSLAPLIVDSTLRIGYSIMAISGLSFIGLGVQPPIPEWGSILASGREFIRQFWPMTVFPGIFIALTLFGFNLFGDGLRDALDPKLKN